MRDELLRFLTPLAATLAALETVRLLAHRRRDAGRWGVAAAVVRRCARPAWAVTVVVVLMAALPSHVSPSVRGAVSHVLEIAVILGICWLAIEVVYGATDVALVRLNPSLGTRDNRRARRARTQLMILRRVVAVAIVVIGFGAALLTFSAVRALGLSVLASAGIVGAIAGVAARPTLGNLIGGMQVAFSDMLRMDDVVVVMGEWGRVDEITLTYVVVRTWDERRLILPTSYFVDNPFQNWTRHESHVIGTVFLTVDFSAPIDAIREEARRIIEASPLWDRREWVLQVTGVTSQGAELRILMSAGDAASSWDLQCEVRERLLAFLRDRQPQALPRLRTADVGDAPAAYPDEPTPAGLSGRARRDSGARH